MSGLRITAKAIRCTEITVAGKNLGLFREESEWNGLKEITRVSDGLMLVIGKPYGEGFAQIFGEAFGGGDGVETYLVNGSPALIREIEAAVAEKTGEAAKQTEGLAS